MLKNKILLFVTIIQTAIQVASAQSYWFGVKGGAAGMSQTFGSSFGGRADNDLGFGISGDIFVESYDEANKGSLYASLGYHSRGSAYQFNSFINNFSARQTFLFRNIGLEVGAKKPIHFDGAFDPYFTVGIRGEYTVGTNLDDYVSFNSLYYPNNAFVRPWTYGFSAGGGFESAFSEFIKYFVDIQIMPDLSYQYIQPPLFNVRDPWDPNVLLNLPDRQARNLTIELKVGIRFLRKIIYED
jgi:hypothetical protein